MWLTMKEIMIMTGKNTSLNNNKKDVKIGLHEYECLIRGLNGETFCGNEDILAYFKKDGKMTTSMSKKSLIDYITGKQAETNFLHKVVVFENEDKGLWNLTRGLLPAAYLQMTREDIKSELEKRGYNKVFEEVYYFADKEARKNCEQVAKDVTEICPNNNMTAAIEEAKRPFQNRETQADRNPRMQNDNVMVKFKR